MKNEIRRRMRGIKRNVGAERLLEVSAGAAALVEGNERYRGRRG